MKTLIVKKNLATLVMNPRDKSSESLRKSYFVKYEDINKTSYVCDYPKFVADLSANDLREIANEVKQNLREYDFFRLVHTNGETFFEGKIEYFMSMSKKRGGERGKGYYFFI